MHSALRGQFILYKNIPLGPLGFQFVVELTDNLMTLLLFLPT